METGLGYGFTTGEAIIGVDKSSKDDWGKVSVCLIEKAKAARVLIWISLLLIVGIVSILLYEILRHNPKYFKVYYTRLSNSNSNRLHPKGLFEWIYWVFIEQEESMLEDVGLDAIMFLRYLLMSFRLFSVIFIIVSLVILPVNYLASSDGAKYNVTTNHGIFEITSTGLSNLSITNVKDGSNLLWIHAACVWMISLVTYLFLYYHYLNFTATAASVLRKKKSGIEALQQRTILISNLDPKLSSKLALEKWFTEMELPVGNVHINTHDDHELMKKTIEFEKTLSKLEAAYMMYAMNIYKSLAWGRLAAVTTGWCRQLSSQQKIYIMDQKMTENEERLSEPFVKNCRPIILSLDRKMIHKVDVINSLTTQLEEIKTQISCRRTEITSATLDSLPSILSLASPQLQKIYRNLQTSSTSAFVTFKKRRSAFIASQVLLHSSLDGFTMTLTKASAPHEVQWKNLTLSFFDKKIKSSAVAILGLTISILWVYPSYYISGLKTEMQDSNFLIFVNQIVPPILVLISAKMAPYLLEFLSYNQSLDSTIQIDCSTLSKYFYFLMFNVHFVFTLLASAWGSSGSFFADPLGWVQLVSITFPDGASFFISFVILNIISFPIELLRPIPILWFMIGSRFYTTPRDLRKFSDSNSLLNYGFLYPLNILVFIVVLCYSAISPLVILPGIVYFGCAWLVYKNQVLYVYVKQSEGYGKFWLMAFRRSVLGLFVFQFLTAGLISAKKANYVAIAVGILLPLTYAFYSYCSNCFEGHDSLIPLESMNESEDLNIEEKDQEANLGESDQELLVSKTKTRITFKSQPLEHLSSDYSHPFLSRPLPKLWIPAYIEHLMNIPI